MWYVIRMLRLKFLFTDQGANFVGLATVLDVATIGVH